MDTQRRQNKIRRAHTLTKTPNKRHVRLHKGLLGSHCLSLLALPLMYFLCVSGVSIFLQGLSLRRRRHRVYLVVLVLLSRVPNDIHGVSSSPLLTFISTQMG